MRLHKAKNEGACLRQASGNFERAEDETNVLSSAFLRRSYGQFRQFNVGELEPRQPCGDGWEKDENDERYEHGHDERKRAAKYLTHL